MTNIATIIGGVLAIVGIGLISVAILMVSGFFGCYSEHEGRNFILRVGFGIGLIVLGGYLMGMIPPDTAVATNATCHWENTSTSTAWVCQI